MSGLPLRNARKSGLRTVLPQGKGGSSLCAYTNTLASVRVQDGSVSLSQRYHLCKGVQMRKPGNLIRMFAVALLTLSGVATGQTVHDDFEDGVLDGWTVPIGSWSIDDGELKIAGAEGQLFLDATDGLTNYEIELRAKYVDGNGYRILFRRSGGLSYLFSYDVAAGNLYLDTSYSGIMDKVEPYSSFDSDWHTIKVRVLGQNFSVSIDGNQVLEGTHPDLTSGGVGLQGWGSGHVESHFDHITVRCQGDLRVEHPIVFDSHRKVTGYPIQNSSVYVIHPGTQDTVRLTDPTSHDLGAAWSPDGTQIAYHSNLLDEPSPLFNIWVMNADGSGKRQLTDHPADDRYPAWSPNGDEIAFQSLRDGNWELYSLDLESRSLTQLTDGPGTHWAPQYSPDGTVIAYEGGLPNDDRELHLLTLADLSTQPLTDRPWFDYSAQWKPDQTQILFSHHLSASPGNLWFMDVPNYSNQIAQSTPGNDNAAAWSPDGKRVALMSTRDGNNEIYIRNPLDVTDERLTNEPTRDDNPSWHEGIRHIGHAEPGSSATRTITLSNHGATPVDIYSISFDHIAFSAMHNCSLPLAGGDQCEVTLEYAPAGAGTEYATLSIVSDDHEAPTIEIIMNGTGVAPPPPDLRIDQSITFFNILDGNNNIYSIRDDGTGLSRITSASTDDRNGVWSPDGTKLAYARWESGGPYHLEVYDLSDSSTESIVTHSQPIVYPDWAPDGTKIVFGSVESGNHDIWVVDADGSNPTQLTTHSAADEIPVWSTDGTRIAWSTWRASGRADIWIMDADGENKTPLISESGWEFPGAWSPDGTKLTYAIDPSASADLYIYDFTTEGSTRITTDGAANVHAVWSADSKKLAFMAGAGGGSALELYTIDVDGMNKRPITSNGYHDQNPSWGEAVRHIGSAVSGASVSTVIRIRNDGVGDLDVTNIEFNDSHFSAYPGMLTVSPGATEEVTLTYAPTAEGTQYSTLQIESNDPIAGTLELLMNGVGLRPPQPELQILGRIAYQTTRHADGGEIYVMNSDGTGPHDRLTNNPAVEFNGRGWSPEGGRILFGSERDGNQEVYVMDSDGSNQTNLSANAAQDGDGSWSPDSSRIAFQSTRDGGDWDIYVMDANGSNVVRLTTSPATDSTPNWSPDGTRIAFQSQRDGSDYEVYVMDADGGNQTRMTFDPGTDELADWSPDGQRIAWTTDRDGDLEIYTLAVSDPTGLQVRLTNNRAADLYPTWSPDGTRIGFATNRDGNVEVYSMRNDGSDVRRLTDHSASDSQPTWEEFRFIGSSIVGHSTSSVFTVTNHGDGTLSVSNVSVASPLFGAYPTNFDLAPGDSQPVTVTFTPSGEGTTYTLLTIESNDLEAGTVNLLVNGVGVEPPHPDLQILERVAFTSNRDGDNEVFTMDPDGGNVAQFTFNGVEDQNPSLSPNTDLIAFESERFGKFELMVMENSPGAPATRLTFNNAPDGGGKWSPDGTRLVYNSVASGNNDVWVLNADGTGSPTQLTTTPDVEAAPVWSPDGEKIAFQASPPGGDYDLYLMNVNGGPITPLPSSAGSDSDPAWSPDGSRIAFDSDRDGDFEIFVMDQDGSNVTQMTNNSSKELWPSWSADGKHLYYQSDRDGNREIYKLRLSDGSESRLTDHPAVEHQILANHFQLVGNPVMGETATRELSIGNRGDADLQIGQITTSDTQFSIGQTISSLTPGEIGAIEIRFTPTAVGPSYAILTIASNDPDAPTVRLLINGVGLEPPNGPPVADAGTDRTGPDAVECAGSSTEITLDGSGSSDPDEDSLTYTWSGVFGSVTTTEVSLVVSLPEGSHLISLVVNDGQIDSQPDEVVVEIGDRTPPQLQAPGDLTVECAGPNGTVVTLGDPTVSDLCDPAPIVEQDAPNTYLLGATVVTWTATDRRGNIATATQTVTVVDTTAPEITLHDVQGLIDLILECNVDNYEEPGATAVDLCVGGVEVDITGIVDTSRVGTYTVTYTAEDDEGNKATATRTVQIVDTLPPIISLIGDPEVTIECHVDVFEDPGATANDLCSGEVTVDVSGSVGEEPGEYVLTYTARDATGNEADPVTRIVHVKDSIAPELTAVLVHVHNPKSNKKGHEKQAGNTHRVGLSATDICDTDASARGWISQPLDGSVLFDVTFKRDKKKRRIEIKVGKSVEVKLRGAVESEMLALWQRAMLLGGFEVNDGDVLKFVSQPKSKTNQQGVVEGHYKYDFDETDIVSAVGPRIHLIAFAEDASGNVAGPVEIYPSNGPLSKPIVRSLLEDLEDTEPSDPRHSFGLQQNYPNPFNPSTSIGFTLAGESHVELVVYNVLGQTVRTLVQGALDAGRHSILWDGRNASGEPVTSGIYLYRISTPEQVAVKKMLYVK
jgi:Tol biopolymer transport system component